MANNSLTLIKRRLSALDPALLVVTHEERRVIEALVTIAKTGTRYKAVLVWTFGVGTECVYARSGSVHKEGSILSEHGPSPLKPLEYVRATGDEKASQHARDVLLILKDCDFFLNGSSGYAVGRALRDLRDQLLEERPDRTTIIAIGTDATVSPRLEKVLTVIDFDLPTEDELTDINITSLEQYDASQPPAMIAEQARKAARAAAGLTAVEASLALTMSIACTGTVDVAMMLSEKKNIVRKSGLLEYYEGGLDLDEVGGLQNLKKWLRSRGGAFSEEAKKYGLPPPQALMLLGTPGTGKSLVAKAIGRAWNMPVLRLDVGSMFGSLVGESEGRMRRALQVATAVAPCCTADTLLLLADGREVRADTLYASGCLPDMAAVIPTTGKRTTTPLLRMLRKPLGDRRLLRVSTTSGKSVKVTEDHLLLVLRSNIRVWVAAKDLAIGDMLVGA